MSSSTSGKLKKVDQGKAAKILERRKRASRQQNEFKEKLLIANLTPVPTTYNYFMKCVKKQLLYEQQVLGKQICDVNAESRKRWSKLGSNERETYEKQLAKMKRDQVEVCTLLGIQMPSVNK